MRDGVAKGAPVAHCCGAIEISVSMTEQFSMGSLASNATSRLSIYAAARWSLAMTGNARLPKVGKADPTERQINCPIGADFVKRVVRILQGNRVKEVRDIGWIC